MTDEEYDRQFQLLLDKAAELPQDQHAMLAPLIEETRILRASNLDVRRFLEDSIGSWLMELKYFLFSLEAAARERATNKD